VRKLNAAQARDWDAEKGEDYSGTSGRDEQGQLSVGAHCRVVTGQIRGTNGQLYGFGDKDEYFHTQGREGFCGRSRGRGRGQRRRDPEGVGTLTREQSILLDSDFPALAPAKRESIVQKVQPTTEVRPKTHTSTVSSTLRSNSQACTTANGSSWAEEMESPTLVAPTCI